MVQFFGGHLLTLVGAAVDFGEPVENAGSAEHMSTRSGQRLLQNFGTQFTNKVRIYGTLETIKIKAHDFDLKYSAIRRTQSSLEDDWHTSAKNALNYYQKADLQYERRALP